jgi:hypothetical protein
LAAFRRAQLKCDPERPETGVRTIVIGARH